VAFEDAIATVDGIADRTFGGWKVPGVAYGVIAGGELRHARGLGTLRVGDRALPDADSVFRIASMTKSFTAATVLCLRDDGRLRLDDPIADHLPQLAGLRGPTRDSPPITIRHLLSMTAGFPTDDPWGDRQQGLDVDDFLRLVAAGLTFAWAPGTRFEYSNLGYGILGRLITSVAGAEYRDVVRERLLAPLAMTSTGYLESEVPPERLAHGYVWRDGAFLDEPMDGYGALASMGGVFTTVRDLTTWVGGFIDAFPPRDEAGMAHPLSRASRREMQQPMTAIGTAVTFRTPDGDPELEGAAYGHGLFVQEHLRWGRIVGHSGGYPGFGSNMRWHTPSGLGVVVLANGRYAPSALLARDLLLALLEADVAPSRRVWPAAPTLAARAAVESLLEAWDDELAGRLFAMNVELDEPLASRRAALDGLRARHGRLSPDASESPVAQSPYQLEWWLRGERGGRVKVEILLSPERSPLVQALNLTSVPAPPAELRAAAERICAALAVADGIAPAWPADLDVAPTLDAAALARALRATEARFGHVHLGAVTAGDGDRAATFRLDCARGSLDLALERDPGTGQLTSVTLRPARLEPVAFG
jgi:CubicO group peptidase (beta-lactamase class C family)